MLGLGERAGVYVGTSDEPVDRNAHHQNHAAHLGPLVVCLVLDRHASRRLSLPLNNVRPWCDLARLRTGHSRREEDLQSLHSAVWV